jgi:hypothetical protein
MAMADGNAAKMAVAMGKGDRNGNGRRQRQRQWATVTARSTVTETAAAMEMAMAIAMVMATGRATMMKGGLLLHVPAMCSAVAGGTPCLHPHVHKRVCVHHCCFMGATLQRVFAPFQGGGFLTAHHGLIFLFFTITVQFTEQPTVCPLHYSGAQEPCQPIDTLHPPLILL